jgi:hypothetical protein
MAMTADQLPGDPDVLKAMILARDVENARLARVEEGSRCGASGIMALWQVSLKTARRDIATLKTANLISHVGSRKGRYQKNDQRYARREGDWDPPSLHNRRQPGTRRAKALLS